DRSTTGDVDLVVRAGTVMIGPSIPPPATSPRTAVAGSPALVPGSGIPFTVAVSDGSSATATGNPLLGPEMDGIPVLVLAFADFDGDGVIGPTSADDDGVADDARELQESDYLIGRQASLLHNGVAQGTLYTWQGAPASRPAVLRRRIPGGCRGPTLPRRGRRPVRGSHLGRRPRQRPGHRGTSAARAGSRVRQRDRSPGRRAGHPHRRPGARHRRAG